MSNVRRAIPNLPPDTPRSLRPLLQSLREAMQVLDNSKRGNQLDAAVTFRDLKNSGLIAGLNSSPTGTRIVTTTPEVTEPEEVIESPTQPTGVHGVGGFDYTMIVWDMPTYSGHSHTEIYRVEGAENDDPVVGDAVLVGSQVGSLFVDEVQDHTGHFYWVRHVNKAAPNEKGPWHSEQGMFLQTAQRYEEIIEEARQKVISDLSVWQGGYANALAILDDEVLRLVLETQGTVETLRQGVEASEGRTTAKYDETVRSVANDLGAATTKIETLAAKTYKLNADGSIKLDGDGNPVFAGAFIDRVDAVLSTIDGQLKASIGETLTVDNGEGVSYSLSEVMSLALDTEGKFTGQWGVKQNVGDLQYGVGFVSTTDENGNVVTGFHVAAHRFSIHNPANGTAVIPFVVDGNGKVLIKETVIDIAKITTLIAEEIITEKLFATKEIHSPRVIGGSLEGTSININSGKFSVNSDGFMRARDALIENKDGEVILSSVSGLDGTYIENLTVDTLKIKKNAVTVQSFSETDTVDVPRGGSGVLWSTSHPHDGRHARGSIMLNILIEAIRTTGGGADDQITFTIEVFETSFYTVLQTHPPVTVGWPENAHTSFFTPVIMYIPDVTQDAVRVKVSAVSAGEAHTISMRVVASSAKR